jgi:hypothetical protein
MRRIFFTLLIILFAIILKAQTNTFPPSGNVGIGTVTTPVPVTKLHIKNNSTTLSNSNFITIDNRGLTPNEGSYTTTHVIGGMLFAGYRDVRNPANIAGIWAVRTSASNGLASYGDLVFGASNNYGTNITTDNVLPIERMRILATGEVGMGTGSPQANLHVATSLSQSASLGLKLATGDGNFMLLNPSFAFANYNNIVKAGDQGIIFSGNGTGTGSFCIAPYINATSGIRIDADGDVSIGTNDTKNYKFAVNGSAIFTKVVVKPYSGWADYVFEPSYKLPSLSSVEGYIESNKHLPGVPSAEDVEANGIDLGDNQTILLQKTEELTLYIIDQDKKLEEQKKLITDQQQMLKQLMEELQKQKQEIVELKKTCGK